MDGQTYAVDDDADTAADDGTGVEVIASVDTLATTFEAVYSLVDETRVHFEPDGLRMTAVDPANAAMIDARLDADACDSYRAGGVELGVNLETILDVLSIPDGDQLAHLVYDPSTRKLEIEAGPLEYTLALIDPDSIRQEPDLPDLELSARVVLEGRDLDRAITAADLASDHVRFRCDADGPFTIAAEGDTDTVEYVFDADEALDLDAGDADSLFSLDYLEDIETVIDADAEVAVRVGAEMPTRLAYSDVNGELHCDFMVAPRIQSD